MNKKLLIQNDRTYHLETIESIIVKHREILNIDNNTKLDIYLRIVQANEKYGYIEYINDKYPEIKVEKVKQIDYHYMTKYNNKIDVKPPDEASEFKGLSINFENYDYYIHCTVYDRYFKWLDNNEKSCEKYISHEITDRLKINPNVYFITPLSKSNYIYADVLPYSNEKKISNIPIYVIQGNLNHGRRYLELLNKILDNCYEYKFIIKLIGRGILPKQLETHKDKIVLKNNLNFIEYHKEFLDAYCILPLISKKTHKDYYTDKLTSTISYARGYKLKCIIDKDLQEIYNLDNVEIYNDINDITVSFIKTLEDFYNKN